MNVSIRRQKKKKKKKKTKKNQFFDEDFEKNLFASFEKELFRSSNAPFFLNTSTKSGIGIQKAPLKMKQKFRPRNLRLNFGNIATPAKDYITPSGNFMVDDLKISSQGIVGYPSYLTQSQAVGGYREGEGGDMVDDGKEIFMEDDENVFDDEENSFSLLYSAKSPIQSRVQGRLSDSGCLRIRTQNLEEITALGEGASSKVFLVKDRKTKRQYAKKVIKISDDGLRVIPDEILALRRCRDCPFIVEFYDAFYFKARKEIHIILEYMDGNSLRDIFKKRGRVPENILSIVAFLCLRALDFLHQKKNIIHRDIKPDNILISKDGNVKLADFGLTGTSKMSRKRGFSLQSNQMVFSTIKGTVLYMSPERIKEKSYGFNSDVWSLGVTLSELRMGYFPFPSSGQSNYFELMDMVNSVTGQKIRSLLAEEYFSPQFREFCSLCMTVEKEKRPSSTKLLQHPFVKKHDGMSVGELRSRVKNWMDTFGSRR